jgi:hypothetical protein
VIVKIFTPPFILGLSLLALSFPARAEFDWECYMKNECRGGTRSSNPSTGGQIRINPAAVPTENGYGIEGIYYKDVDFSLVRGLGRVGAAISPSNSEETFFGPPGIETTQDYLQRHLDSVKYPNQKYNLAAAAKLIDNKSSGLTQFNLSLGVMGKYNKYTTNVSPGGGLTGSLGPLTVGGSYYLDETQMNGDLPKELRPPAIRYNVQTYNLGLFLSSAILDYSHLQVQPEHQPPTSKVTLYTASLLAAGFIITASKREEESTSPHYNPTTKALEYPPIKEDYFGGVQYSVTKNLMLGVLYNYYLLQEGSVSATLFF